MRRGGVLVVLMVMAAMSLQGSGELSVNETKKCQLEVENLQSCLIYAQKGSSSAPTDKCCSDVSGIRSRDVACLCYLLTLAVSGDESIKSLNLDSTRMLQLPTLCKIQNTSVSDCPRLLGLPSSSPDAAIFSGNATKTSGGATSPTSGAYMHRPSFDGCVVYAIFTALFFSIFPAWP